MARHIPNFRLEMVREGSEIVPTIPLRPSQMRWLLRSMKCTFDEAVALARWGYPRERVHLDSLTVEYKIEVDHVHPSQLVSVLRRSLQENRDCVTGPNTRFVGRPDALSAEQMARLLNLTLNEFAWFTYEVSMFWTSFGRRRFWYPPKDVAYLLREYPDRQTIFERRLGIDRSEAKYTPHEAEVDHPPKVRLRDLSALEPRATRPSGCGPAA